MSAHRPHPISGTWMNGVYDDPPAALLFDDCDRCAQQATDPRWLDEQRLGHMWQRMVDVEREGGNYATRTEGVCGRTLYLLACLAQRAGVDPWQWPWAQRVPLVDVPVRDDAKDLR